MRKKKENSISGNVQAVWGLPFSAGRLVGSLLLAVLIFLSLSYNLRIHYLDESASTYDRIVASFGTYGPAGNLYVLGIAAALYLWFTRFGDRGLFYSKSITALACLFGLLNTAAYHLFYRNALPWNAFKVIFLFFVQAAVWALLFLLATRLVLCLLEAIAQGKKSPFSQLSVPVFEKKPFLFAFVLILLGWLPWIISYYPASMEWDVYDPIMRYLGLSVPNDNHPWFYTCVIGWFYSLGEKMGDRNVGVFLYTVLRAVLMSAIYAKCVVMQKRIGLPKWICILTVLFYAFTPVWGAYAKHAFKDSFSAALSCWFSLAMIGVIYGIKRENLNMKMCLEYSVAGLACCLFRHNVGFVVLLTTAGLVYDALKHRQKTKFILMLLCGVLLFQFYHLYIYNVAGVARPDYRDAMSVFYQQTARTVKQHGGTITEEEKEAINSYLDYDRLAERYDPIISDPVKGTERGERHSLLDYQDYLKVWRKMGLKYPYSYLEAFIAHGSGYYAFTPEYTDAERYGPGAHDNVGMSIFTMVKDPRFDDDFTCSYVEGMKGLRSILDSWAEIWHQIPILNLTDTKPLYTWVTVLIAWVLLRRREKIKLIPVLSLLLMIATCVMMPVNDCFRYFAPVAASFPAMMILLKPGYWP